MKKLLKRIIAVTVLICTAAVAFADALNNKNAIGIYIIGSERAVGGIQYERRFTDVISTKFGTYALVRNKSDYFSDTPIDFNFVVEPDIKLFETTWNGKVCSRLFAFGLLGYEFSEKSSYHYDEGVHEYIYDKSSIEHGLIVGAGFGFDFIFFDHLSVPIQFGFTGTIDKDPFVGFGGGIALRYSW